MKLPEFKHIQVKYGTWKALTKLKLIWDLHSYDDVIQWMIAVTVMEAKVKAE